MVDKINPDTMTSSQYGEALLQRKAKRQEEQYKRERKDAKIGYAMQVLGGIDTIMTNRARETMLDRDRQLDHLIVKEKAEYKRLQKEFDAQQGFRDAIENGNGAQHHAYSLAQQELDQLGKYSGVDWTKIDRNSEFAKEYEKHVQRIGDQKLAAYNKNRVSMPASTEEEYISPLTALKGQKVNGGLLNFVAEKVGWRDPQELASIDTLASNYRGDLLTDQRGKGVTSQTAADLNLFNPAQGDLRQKSTYKVRGQGKNTYMVRIDQDGNEMPIPLDQVPMKGSVSMTLFPRDSQDVQEDLTSFMMKYPNAASPDEIYKVLATSNPNLYREAFNLGLIPPSKSRFNTQEKKNTISSYLTKGEFVTEEKAKQFESMPEGQVPFLIDQIIRNADEYSKNGYIDVNGVLNQVTDEDAINLAIKNQLKGITWSEQEGFLGIGEDIATYDARPNQEHKLEATKVEQISKGKLSNPQEVQRFFDLPKSQEEFKKLSIPERLEVIKKYEEDFDMTLDVDPSLLEPNSLDIAEEDRNIYSQADIDSGRPERDREAKKIRQEKEEQSQLLNTVTDLIQDIRVSSVNRPRYKVTMTANDYDEYIEKRDESIQKAKEFEEKFGFSLDKFIKEKGSNIGLLESRLNKNPNLLNKILEFLQPSS
tara:strand:- start:693 stop:2639 length:1947 start_codon:yes stop_codon:yes gene_type:complete